MSGWHDANTEPHVPILPHAYQKRDSTAQLKSQHKMNRYIQTKHPLEDTDMSQEITLPSLAEIRAQYVAGTSDPREETAQLIFAIDPGTRLLGTCVYDPENNKMILREYDCFVYKGHEYYTMHFYYMHHKAKELVEEIWKPYLDRASQVCFEHMKHIESNPSVLHFTQELILRIHRVYPNLLIRMLDPWDYREAFTIHGKSYTHRKNLSVAKFCQIIGPRQKTKVLEVFEDKKDAIEAGMYAIYAALFPDRDGRPRQPSKKMECTKTDRTGVRECGVYIPARHELLRISKDKTPMNVPEPTKRPRKPKVPRAKKSLPKKQTTTKKKSAKR
jgi:hypothetical protein